MRRALIERARQFRKNLTRSEAILWEALRGRSLGVRFHRQKVVGPFIPDFVCERPKLVVEIDGPVHDKRRERDAERQRWLEADGYVVLRVTDEDVEQRTDSVLESIRATLALAGRRRPTPGALLVSAASSRK